MLWHRSVTSQLCKQLDSLKTTEGDTPSPLGSLQYVVLFLALYVKQDTVFSLLVLEIFTLVVMALLRMSRMFRMFRMFRMSRSPRHRMFRMFHRNRLYQSNKSGEGGYRIAHLSRGILATICTVWWPQHIAGNSPTFKRQYSENRFYARQNDRWLMIYDRWYMMMGMVVYSTAHPAQQAEAGLVSEFGPAAGSQIWWRWSTYPGRALKSQLMDPWGPTCSHFGSRFARFLLLAV